MNLLEHCNKYLIEAQEVEIENARSGQKFSYLYGDSPLLGKYKLLVSSKTFWINQGSGTGAKNLSDFDRGAGGGWNEAVKEAVVFIISPTDDAPQMPSYRGYDRDMGAQSQYQGEWRHWAKEKLSNL